MTAGTGAAPTRPGTRRAALLTARVGVVQAILLLAAYWTLSQAPGANATPREIADFYSSDRRTLIVIAGLYLMPFAGIAFLWFAVALRMWIQARGSEHALLSNVQLVSAIVYIALFFASAAASSVLALSYEAGGADAIDALAVGEFPRYGTALLLVFAMRMAAIFVFTTSTIARRRGIMPRWFVAAGYVVGLFLLLSSSLSALLILVFPVWILLLSALLLLEARRLPPDEAPG